MNISIKKYGTVLTGLLVASSLFLLAGVNLVDASGGIVRGTEAVGTLDYIEVKHLSFMREEEKLARDVYLTLHARFKNTKTPFSQIDDSEQRHTDAVAGMLHRYGETDPNTDDAIGVYTGDYADYLTQKYHVLVDVDTPYPDHPLNHSYNPLLNALYHGAFIEELDMNDIAYCPYVMLDGYQEGEVYYEPVVGIDPAVGCGRDYTDEEAIKQLYGNLLNGSENHLRAYVYAIEQIIGEGQYQAQYLTPEEVNVILGR
jgi:hypothetical protein